MHEAAARHQHHYYTGFHAATKPINSNRTDLCEGPPTSTTVLPSPSTHAPVAHSRNDPAHRQPCLLRPTQNQARLNSGLTSTGCLDA